MKNVKVSYNNLPFSLPTVSVSGKFYWFFKVEMPKAGPLQIGVESNLRDRLLGEVEMNHFNSLPVIGGCSGLMPLKNCVSQSAGIW